jgi:hypothetical protein
VGSLEFKLQYWQKKRKGRKEGRKEGRIDIHILLQLQVRDRPALLVTKAL